jgi:hypothetical protein
MHPYRMNFREYTELVAETKKTKRMKRGDSKPIKGLPPLRRPVDHSGRKLRGKDYRDWQEEISDQDQP